MSDTWRLKRTAQCKACPWRKDVDPFDIPNGYDLEKHRALKNTIADEDAPLAFLTARETHVMACHEAEQNSWMMLFATSVSRNGSVTISTKNLHALDRIVPGDDGSIDAFGSYASPGLSVGLPVPVEVMHLQEGSEVLSAARTAATQKGNRLKPGVIVVSPRGCGGLSAIDIVLAGIRYSLSDFGLLSLEPPGALFVAGLRLWALVNLRAQDLQREARP